MTCTARHGHTCPLCRGPGRPPLSDSSPTVRFSISVPASVRAALVAAAEDQGRRVAEVSRGVLSRWAKRQA